MEKMQKEHVLSNQISEKELIGKSVVDSYGWMVGRIIGFTFDSQKSISSIGIELSRGGFMKCSASEIILNQEIAVLNNSWRLKAESQAEEVALVNRKISALNELKSDVEVSKRIYLDLERRFEDEKRVLLERRRYLKDRLKERMEEINAQLKEVYEFITHIKISHHIGDIDEEAYQQSYISFQRMINRLHAEEEEVKTALNIVATNISALPPEPLKPLPPSEPQITPIKLRIRSDDALEI